MTETSLPDLAALLREHGMKYRKVLTCAQDVWDALMAQSRPKEKFRPEGAFLDWLTGIEVAVIASYAPGEWKLTRHDSCEVTGGHEIDHAIIVTHGKCTILAESGQP